MEMVHERINDALKKLEDFKMPAQHYSRYPISFSFQALYFNPFNDKNNNAPDTLKRPKKCINQKLIEA